MQKKVVIIGAGPAGLTAAYMLSKVGDYKPLIIEKTNQIGGIAKTVFYKGNGIDLGGHRFFSKSKEVNDIWSELLSLQGMSAKDELALKVDCCPHNGKADPESEDAVMLKRRRISRIFAFGKFFDYPISISFSTFFNLGIVRTISVAWGYCWAVCRKLPNTSLENFYINRFGRALYRLFFEKYTEKVWGKHPSCISAEWGAQRVKSLSIAKVLKESLCKCLYKNFQSNTTSLISSFYYPKFGPGQLWDVMLDKVVELGGTCYFEKSIQKFLFDGDKITAVEICDDNGNKEIIECEAVFSSMPISELVSLLNPPTEVGAIASSLPYRDFITVGILVKNLKIQNKTKIKTIAGLPPDNWIYIQDDGVRLGRLQIYNNWSPYLVSDYKNTVWLGLEYFCSKGDELWNMAQEKLIQLAVDELVKIGIIEKQNFIDATVIKVEKAYPSYFGSYSEFFKIRKFLDHISNLYCIGRNGQHRYNNMDHSMLTAIRAVEVLRNSSKSRNEVWAVNTDDEYHEYPN